MSSAAVVIDKVNRNTVSGNLGILSVFIQSNTNSTGYYYFMSGLIILYLNFCLSLQSVKHFSKNLETF